ncbi:hypothetical protein J6590_106313, partial [Homalodisca vitripennis]
QGCKNDVRCVNCKGKHAATSKECRVYLEEKEVLKIVTLNKLSFNEARKEYRRRIAPTPKKGVSYSEAASAPVQSAQCPSCTALEGMVRNLAEQVAALVKQLAAGTGQHPLASTSNPSQAVHTPHTKSNTQIQARPTVTPTFRDRVQQNTKPALSLEERKKLADKLKKNIQAKSENRSKFLVKKTNPSSSRSSQLSLDDDMVEDPLEMQTEFQTVQGNFRPVSKQRKKITMN